MTQYAKGARSERELIRLLIEKGFSVVRAAGSGVAGECPDILAFRRGIQYAFECKAWGGERVALDNPHFDALRRWEENTGITTMLAWRMDKLGWCFMYLNELEKNPKSWSATKKRALEIGRKIEAILR
jgi:Holliday junction resolvase